MILPPTSVVYTLSLLSGVIFSVFGFGVKMGGVEGVTIMLRSVRCDSRAAVVSPWFCFLEGVVYRATTAGVDLIWEDLLWGWIG